MSEQHELETLRVLLNLPPEVLRDFEPRRPPQHIQRYVKHADRRECQWLLVDVLHRLRTTASRRDRCNQPENSENGERPDSPAR